MWGRSLAGMGPTVPVGGTTKEAGPTVPLGKNLCLREELGQEWVTLCHWGQICM